MIIKNNQHKAEENQTDDSIETKLIYYVNKYYYIYTRHYLKPQRLYSIIF